MLSESGLSAQIFSGVTSLAGLVLNAGNAPKEIRHCLELAQAACLDARYLIELRSENLTALQDTPRELERAENALLLAQHSVKDVGVLLEKYRPLVTANAASSSSTQISWDDADIEAFSLRIPKLQIQHTAVLQEISHLRTFRLLRLGVQIENRTEQAGNGDHPNPREPATNSGGVGVAHVTTPPLPLDSATRSTLEGQEENQPQDPISFCQLNMGSAFPSQS
ncbi:hypothetical protein GQ53DRAFT_836810 [Thozetella sp. PMI_491]|nr:hypothetical protein GQ53DRAFT_836810 [Thozetella sp. PMI_491]